MTKGKPRDERKEQQWRRWIKIWRTSGLSVRAFCVRHGLGPPSFYAWRRELAQLVVDHGQQLTRGLGFAVRDGLQQLGDVAHELAG